ncbi:MAG: helicase-related protein [Kiritimatiellia bacterium]
MGTDTDILFSKQTQPHASTASISEFSNIRDNCKRGKAFEFLKSNVTPNASLSVASAYFTVQAYDALREQLDAIEGMRFLFGDPSYVSRIDPEKTASKRFSMVNNTLEIRDALRQKASVKACADWIRQKVEIKSVINRALLHGKLYHVGRPERDSRAMFGSSNFTTRGLGMAASPQNNIELNMMITDQRDRDDLLAWFNELWSDDRLVYNVKADVLDFLSKLYTDQTPEFIYFKTLYHIFEKEMASNQRIEDTLAQLAFDQSEIWKNLFDFQRDGVKGIINKLKDYNGCILADSVGLGKTFTALAVIHYFRLQNERVLVLTPKKLSDNWLAYRGNNKLNIFEKDGLDFDVASHTDLSRTTGDTVGGQRIEGINWGNYGLVVIDESHNFRNGSPEYRADDPPEKKNRYQRLMDDVIKSGFRTKVLLLSATPVNNSLRDLRNQIALFTKGVSTAYADPSVSLGIPDYAILLMTAQKQFTKWAKLPPEERKTSELVDSLGSDFFRLLDGVTIARARKHILRYFVDDVARLGAFPERKKPLSISTEIDTQGLFLPYDEISEIIETYKLFLFKPTMFVKEEFKAIYDTTSRGVSSFKQSDRENFLIGMMKTNFLKRLESSIRSFEYTLKRTIDRIDTLERALTKFKDVAGAVFEAADEQGAEEEQEDLFEEAVEFSTGKKKTFQFAHMKVDEFLEALHQDKRQLNKLYLQARDVTAERDLKLAELKKLLAKKFTYPTTDRDGRINRKVIVFTAFADTAEYLYNHLHAWALDTHEVNSALVSGSRQNRTTYKPQGFESQSDYNRILIHFSPRSKHREKLDTLPQEGGIDLLIATDCISEGQNLQDCDTLINYDIHWNPVRIIQRFGRIDRIGSRNPSIQLINFWPTDDLNKYIRLKHRVETRMALVDIAATQEDNPLANKTMEEMVDDAEIRYRDRQLKKLRDEVIDLEDANESFSISDFTLEDFRADLLKFLEKNKELLEGAPLGLYAVVPSCHDLFTEAAPGVIFCFRQKEAEGGDTAAPEKINPLHPCYLVYIQDNGNVRFSFGLPHKILALYRELCTGKVTAYKELCDLFDKQTKDGSDMTHYDTLLEKALKNIAGNYRRRIAQGLTTTRDFVIPTQSAAPAEFELLTWLVIKSESDNK